VYGPAFHNYAMAVAVNFFVLFREEGREGGAWLVSRF